MAAPSGAALRSHVMKGLAWRSGGQIVAQLITWSATFVVIRMLLPQDYGTFALTQALITLLTMLAGESLATAVIREEVLDRGAMRQIFGMLILLNAGLALFQCAVAPLVAIYYHQPIVTDLLRVQAFAYLAGPPIAIGRAVLSHRMDFRSQTIANVIAALAGAATGLAGAFAGWGVWTLVTAPLVTYFVRAVMLSVRASSLIRPSFRFSRISGSALFGATLTLSQLIWLVQMQSDVMIAGRHVPPAELGLYTTSLFLAQILTSKLLPSINEVSFAAYARLAGDREAVAAAFARSLRMVMAIALPFYAGMALTAEPLILSLLGPHWAGAVPIVRTLAIAMPFMTFQVMFAPVTSALGRPIYAVYGAAAGAVLMPCAYLFAIRWGVTGLSWAWVAAYPLLAIFTTTISMPLIGVRIGALAGAVLPGLGAMLGMVAAILIARHLLPLAPDLVSLVALTALGAISYAAGLYRLCPAIFADFGLLRARR